MSEVQILSPRPVKGLRSLTLIIFSGKNLPEKSVTHEVFPQKKISVRDVMAVL